VRLVQFAPSLEDQGIELSYRPVLTADEYSLLGSKVGSARKVGILGRAALRLLGGSNPNGADLTIVHRARFLLPIPGAEPLPGVDVYDFDDALFVGSVLPVNRRFGWVKREAQRCHAYMRRARLVVAGNAYLADYAGKMAQRVEVVPSCVEPSRQPLHEHADRETVTVGWIGSPSTEPYLREVIPVFERLNSDRIQARLVVVGAVTGVRAPWIEERPWSLASERDDLAGFDLGIMPVPDNPWTRGKCGYKILQYFAAGVPAIASPVGVNRSLISPERGRLAESPKEWLDAVTELLGDPGLRGQLGRAGRTFVEQKFSYERWAPELASMLHDL
jgi:glycosyltransferase involved in cell wall biosynthesis